MPGDELERFRSEAAHYCDLVEHEGFELHELLKTLLRLVDRGLALSECSPDTDEPAVAPEGLDADAAVVAKNVQQSIGIDFYWELFDSLSLPELPEPVAGSLVDDLVDIYRDLRVGLQLADTGSLTDAAWEWRFSFRSHWGRHATSAIRVLFLLVVE